MSERAGRVAPMKVRVASEGGIGNLGIRGELRLDELSPELKAQAQRVLAAAGRRRRAAPERPGAADAMRYELCFVPEDDPERVTRLRLSDFDDDAEALALARALLREVARRAKGGGAGS